MRTYKTQSGSVLEIKPVSAMLVQAVLDSIKEPEVPVFYNEAKDRTEPNPMDPVYVKAVEKHQTTVAMKVNDAMLINGVRVVELGPDKQALDDADWIERVRYAGVEVADRGIAREAAWLRYHIIDDADLIQVLGEIGRAGGLVTEEDVAVAASSFRTDEVRPTDTELPTEEGRGLGDTSINGTRDDFPIRMPTSSEVQPIQLDRVAGTQ